MKKRLRKKLGLPYLTKEQSRFKRAIKFLNSNKLADAIINLSNKEDELFRSIENNNIDLIISPRDLRIPLELKSSGNFGKYNKD